MSLISDFVKQVVLGQVRTYLPTITGAAVALGVQDKIDPTSLQGAVYYIISSAFVIIPAIGSYLQKKSVKDLLTEAVADTPKA